jgi:arsenical resistance protein ArsH
VSDAEVTVSDAEVAFPALDIQQFDVPETPRLAARTPSRHRPRFLMLYGSVRERS